MFDATPTPIATPSNNTSFRLRDFSEDDFIGHLNELQVYSYQNYPPYSDWWSDGMFGSSQKTSALVIQEYLYRYPVSPNAERLKWQLAFIDALVFNYVGYLGGNIYNEVWVVAQLENSLNQNQISPENLEELLDQYWLDVDYYQPVDNLFGNGETSWFYVIRPQVWEHEETYEKSPNFFQYGGLFVVVRKIEEGGYKAYLLENSLSFVNGASSLFEISDFNQNGFVEIALNIGYHAGSMCGGNFKVFEWKDNAFIDLTHGAIKIYDCSDRHEYMFAESKPSIMVKRFFTKIPSIYVWNGSYYEFSGYESTSLTEQWFAAYLDHRMFYEGEATAIEAILSSDQLDGLSFAHGDFLRFRLGLVYALALKPSQAKRVFRDLADNPLDISRSIYSEYAENFLKYYSGDHDLFHACEKNSEFQKDLQRGQESEDVFGVSFDPQSGFGPGLLVCRSSDVLRMLVGKIPVTVKDVPNALQENGVELSFAENLDINLDGSLDELLIIVDDDLYVVFRGRLYYDILKIDSFWNFTNSISYSNIRFDIGYWTGIQNPVLVISTEEELSIISIGENYHSTWLSSAYDVENVLISSQDSPAQFQVFYRTPRSENDDYYAAWEGYRWDSARHMFRDDLLEYTLFVERNPSKAVEIADAILPVLINWRELGYATWWLPRYFYICGLSYELAGDTQKAAEIYWQLWRNFPESQYAILAKNKLEPIIP